MILVDTSIWADHLRRGDARLAALLNDEAVVLHALVIAELALGPMPERDRLLRRLDTMPRLPTASDDAFLAFCCDRPVIGRGIGVIDVHLLIATERHGASLWTRDLRLADAADELSISVDRA